MPRALALLVLVLVLALAAAAWLASDEFPPDAAPASGPAPLAQPPAADTLALASAPAARVEPGAPEPDGAGEREAVATEPGPDLEPDEDAEWPPTPESPGPDQALLRVEVVSRETGAPLADVDLVVLPADEDYDGPWHASTQTDPSRGVEADFVTSDADGRAEFVLRADFEYTLHGHPDEGRVGPARLELEPLAAGETRSVRLALPTEWAREWHGLVVDGASGRPLAGVDAVARTDPWSFHHVGPIAEFARARTGADGLVVLRLPEWVRTVVHCEADGWFPGGAELLPWRGTEDAPERVTLRRPAALVVRAREADGSAAAGIGVRVTTSFDGVRRVRPVGVDWSGATGADGRCELAPLPSEEGLFVVLAREGASEWTTMSEPFRLAPGERRELSWTLDGGATLRGRVRDREGRAVAGLTLSLWKAKAAFQPSRPVALERWVHSSLLGWRERDVASVTTDAEGGFAFDALRPGSWFLETSEDETDVPGGVWAFVVRAGAAWRELDLRLDRGLSIEGVLLGPDGAPAPGAHVSCGREDSVWSAATTDERGAFSLGPLPAGRYAVHVRPPRGDPHVAASEELELDAGVRGVTLALRRGGRLVVEPTADGAALDDEVEAILLANGRRVDSADELAFDGVLPGTYDVVAWHGERVGVARGVEVTAHATRAVPVSLALGARVLVPPGTRAELEWEGLQLDGSEIVPPGTVAIRLHSSDDRAVGEQTRVLAAAQFWRVEVPE